MAAKRHSRRLLAVSTGQISRKPGIISSTGGTRRWPRTLFLGPLCRVDASSAYAHNLAGQQITLAASITGTTCTAAGIASALWSRHRAADEQAGQRTHAMAQARRRLSQRGTTMLLSSRLLPS